MVKPKETIVPSGFRTLCSRWLSPSVVNIHCNKASVDRIYMRYITLCVLTEEIFIVTFDDTDYSATVVDKPVFVGSDRGGKNIAFTVIDKRRKIILPTKINNY